MFVSSTLSGGSFDTAPASGIARIVVGIDEDWPMVVSTIAHEAVELACAEMGLRFRPSPDYSGDSGAYLFMMDHAQFSEAIARASYFLSAVLPKLASVFKSNRSKTAD